MHSVGFKLTTRQTGAPRATARAQRAGRGYRYSAVQQPSTAFHHICQIVTTTVGAGTIYLWGTSLWRGFHNLSELERAKAARIKAERDEEAVMHSKEGACTAKGVSVEDILAAAKQLNGKDIQKLKQGVDELAGQAHCAEVPADILSSIARKAK